MIHKEKYNIILDVGGDMSLVGSCPTVGAKSRPLAKISNEIVGIFSSLLNLDTYARKLAENLYI
jgi:hypothetical protein